MTGRTQSKSKVSRKTVSPRKTREAADGAGEPITPPSDGNKQLELRIKKSEAERDQLAEELASAREEIAQLKAKHTQAVNQIDWVLDSLHNIVDDKL